MNSRRTRFTSAFIVSLVGISGCEGPPEDQPLSRLSEAQVVSPARSSGPPSVLTFVPPGAARVAAATGTQTTRTVSVFYPTLGQSSSGACWQGVTTDAAGNVYPLGNGQVYKTDPKGKLINGVNDTNFFATSDVPAISFVLDLTRQTFFSANRGLHAVGSAPFVLGSVFATFVNDPTLGNAEAVTLGQGPLAGSLFVSGGAANVVSRVIISPPTVSVFASGPLIASPFTLASAADGTLYVAMLGTDPNTLVKITPAGVVSRFATSTFAAAVDAAGMVAVDDEGTVFWSSPTGIRRYKPSGTRLTDLAGPPDQKRFLFPTAGAFDIHASLFVVDNGACKKIYKYTETKL